MEGEDEKIIGPRRLTKYERARILSFRAQQIAAGSPLFLEEGEIPEGEVDPVKLAELELELGKLPLIIERKLPGKSQLIPLRRLLEEEEE